MVKILETRAAPNPRRVRIFLAEKGIEVPFEELDLMKGALKTPEFTKVNRLQRVPVLVLDDGTAIAETMAICRYFDEVKPEPALFGTGPRERAMVEMWARRMEFNLLWSVAQAFRHLHPAMAHLEVPQVADWGEANKPRVLEVLQFMDEELASRPYIAGEQFSVADITGLVAVDFMRAARIQRPVELKNVERWHQAVSARPSAKA
jgi:glutathione S-transferase